MLFNVIFILSSSISVVFTSIDIAVVYEQSLLFLKNASQPLNGNTSVPTEKFTTGLSYPIALAYDADVQNFYISDANSQKTEIFSFTVKNGNISSPHQFNAKIKESTIEAITWDQSNSRIFWTDSSKNGIYFGNITNSLHGDSSSVLVEKHNSKPRGITLDYCNRNLYWTERNGHGSPTIEVYNLDTHAISLFKESSDDTFYQGVYFNSLREEIIWAETTGDDERNSSCRILSKSVVDGTENVICSLENCYPYAIVADLDNIYWSDWARHSIMRYSRNNSDSLVKLVDTPPLPSKEGHHNGAFGMDIVKGKPGIESCLKQPVTNVKDSLDSTTPVEFILDLNGNEHMMADGVNTVYDRGDGLSWAKSSAQTINNDYSFVEWRKIVIVLSVFCALFFSTTVVLALHTCGIGRKIRISISSQASTGPPSPVEPTQKSRHRTFSASGCVKAKPKYLYPAEPNDGVKIDIEDCCQMTLCDTPCYTRIKKEGKGYKKSQVRASDKVNLLSDPENCF